MRSKLVGAVSMLAITSTALAGWALVDATGDAETAVSVVHNVDGELLELPGFGDVPVAAPELLGTNGPATTDGIRRGVVVDAGGELITTWPTPSWTYRDTAIEQHQSSPASTSIAARVLPPGEGIQAATADETAGRGPRFVPATPTTTSPDPPTTTAPGTPTTTTTTTTTVPGSPTTTPTPTTTQPVTGFDLSLDRFYINQAVPVLDTAQAANERIRPVGRRGGLARAFVSANESNSVRPEVELHWRHPGGASGVIGLTGPGSAPTNPSEASLGSTFNNEFGNTILVPGTEVFIVVDPRNVIPEANEGNNRWPSTGWANANVADIPVFEVTWVPVIWEGVQGNINAGNVAQYEDLTMRMMPIPGIDSQIHSPIVFNGDLRTGAGWSQLLNQVAQLRAAEGSDRAYHAIVRRAGNSGIAGIAYTGLEAAVSFDDPRGASSVVAHEFGHNFGLPHAPCGVGGDPNFPYSNARIGTWGYDLVADVAIDPGSNVRDVMSYCDPAWISDYNFRNVLNNRLASAFVQQGFVGSALHVSGVIDEGVATIDPAYALDEGGVSPAGGEYTLVGSDVAGTRLFEVPFAAHEAEINGGEHSHEEYFSFSVPVTTEILALLDTLTVEFEGTPIGQRISSSTSMRLVESAEQQVNADGTTTVTWDGEAEIAVVRDAASGEVLAVSESGSAEIVATDGDIEVVLSDGMGATASEMVTP